MGKSLKWDVSDAADIGRAEVEFNALAAAGCTFKFNNDAKDPRLERLKGIINEFDGCYGNLAVTPKVDQGKAKPSTVKTETKVKETKAAAKPATKKVASKPAKKAKTG